MHLNHRTAIVTGASMGIGAAASVALAERGVTVWAVARNRERLEAIAARHAGIHPIVADVTLDADRERLVEAVGGADILVNNAGIASMGLVESTSQETTRQMFEVNILGLIDLTQRVLPSMLQQKRGHICNVGSSISYMAAPPLTLYAATKYAVEGFSDGLRREVSHRGVGVSLIQPGPVKTAFWDRAAQGDRPDAVDGSGAGIPAAWVANAIVRAIRFDHVPGYRHVAVPRPLGLGRLLDIPGVALAIDTASRFRPHPIDALQIPYENSHRQDAEVIPIEDARRHD